MKTLLLMITCLLLAACNNRYQVYPAHSGDWVIKTDTQSGRVWEWDWDNKKWEEL
jgi:hypothetical protein